LTWCGEDTGSHAGKTCFMSKTFRILGCSYLFLDDKTNAIWELMDDEIRAKWPLALSGESGIRRLSGACLHEARLRKVCF
jgi:hypothetical protein